MYLQHIKHCHDCGAAVFVSDDGHLRYVTVSRLCSVAQELLTAIGELI